MKKASLILAVVALGMFLFAGSSGAVLIEFFAADGSAEPIDVWINNSLVNYGVGYLEGGTVFHNWVNPGQTTMVAVPVGLLNLALDLGVEGYKTDCDKGVSFQLPVYDDAGSLAYYQYMQLHWNGITTAFTFDGFDKGGVKLFGSNPAPVPEPATMLLLGTGLVGLAGFGRKKFFGKG
jgi:hypothetical protein